MTKIVGKVKVLLNHAGDSIVNITIDANFGLMNKPIVSTVLDFSDALVFLICVPNIIGLYMLAPLVKRELTKYNRKHIEGK